MAVEFQVQRGLKPTKIPEDTGRVVDFHLIEVDIDVKYIA